MGLMATNKNAIRKSFLVAATISVALLAGCDSPAPTREGAPATMRRLTQEQYKNIIADVFGPDINIAGRMDPDLRKDGLLQIGATEATFTPGNLEQYDALARGIATEVLAEKRRASFMPCTPASATAVDEACAKEVITEAGRLLFRRPLTAKEAELYVGLATAATEKVGYFYKGLEFGLASLMVSPNFLFQKDMVEADPSVKGAMRLDAYSKASRLSFFLWNSAPDDMLLAAAENGDLNSSEGLDKQAQRMIKSPRLKNGVRGFFADFLQFTLFESLAKDPVIYPKFSQSVSDDAKEQTLRTVTEFLVTDGGDYRDLFTSHKTYLTRALGVVYQVPVPASTDSEWLPYEFPKDDMRGGLLTQLSFTALYAHPGRSSPTLRGKAIREVMLCQAVPIPPVNVDFTSFEADSHEGSPVKTARERLAKHSTDPACAGCHKFVDPMGLALENFDGLGVVRMKENGADIDASGELDGVKFNSPAGLAAAMRNSPRTSACIVKKLFAYGQGANPGKSDEEYLKYLQTKFEQDKYSVPQLMRRIVTSEAFYRVSPSEAPAQANASREPVSTKENKS